MAGFKICGITNTEDLDIVLSVNPDMVGFVVSESPRRVEPNKAKDLVAHAEGRAQTVMVTTSQDGEEINDLRELVNPDFVQLHSEISMSEHIEGRKIGMVKVDGELDLLKEKTTQLVPFCEYILFDTGAGTGRTHDWEKTKMLRNIAEEKTILAGGLNPENVAEAIKEVNPYLVDVSSGVEAYPGKKDPEKIKKFAEVVRNAYGI
jgi:phosphoribosylanthranilate isomerase